MAGSLTGVLTVMLSIYSAENALHSGALEPVGVAPGPCFESPGLATPGLPTLFVFAGGRAIGDIGANVANVLTGFAGSTT